MTPTPNHRKPSVSLKQEIHLEIFASNMSGMADIGIAVSASRCGATGIVNVEGIADEAVALELLTRAARLAAAPLALRLGESLARLHDLQDRIPENIGTVIVPARLEAMSPGLCERLSNESRRLLFEVTSGRQAEMARSLPVQGLIAKGHEAGGYVGEETTFVLIQRLLLEHRLPIVAWGGIGVHTVAACYTAGVSGVVIDAQLLLTPQASITLKLRAALERMDGDETVCPGAELEQSFRFFKRPGFLGADALLRADEELLAGGKDSAPQEWRQLLSHSVDWNAPERGVWPLGQDAAFAAGFVRRFRTLAGIVNGLRASVAEHVRAAQAANSLAPHSAFARSHAMRYPIFQGPMTRVSDSARFAADVAAGGGLPFLALALLRGPQVQELLTQTKELLGDRTWGVGILGFVPADLRAEQLAAIDRVRPPCAIIAGGRPDQAAGLEKSGIPTYLHVPAPALLTLFLEGGARRFIFEGRECGGHVGPRTSFVLWEAMIETLLEAIRKGIPAGDLHVVFAGGIHDAVSASMVSVLAATLAQQGVRVGVLMGTAYLFTEEAVAGGAIVEGFQAEVLACRDTVTLISGPGHITRCAETPFNVTFREERRRLLSARNSVEETRDRLENLNLGRLRIASKGLRRNGNAEGSLETVAAHEQRSEGMYMAGQVAALRTRTCTIAQLHQEVSEHGSALVRQLAPGAEIVPSPRAEIPPCDIAIVGMSCLLPKAPDSDTFWANIIGRLDAVEEVPAARFDIARYYDPNRDAPDKVYSKWGGFLDSVPFDPMRWGIPPAALASIDPMQLLALVAVERAMKDAGYHEPGSHNATTSVILGLSGGLGDLGIDYAMRANLPQIASDIPSGVLDQLPAWTEDSFAGILLNVAAGRVANRFDFGGVNFTVDAACASSLAALYLAARELTSGASDMVVAGGVDTVQSPFGYLCFSKSQALSPRGKCSPFDESADGIAISEGLSIVVLKRLADAERAGDRIYAVVKGIAGSSDGRGRSMTAPRAEGQKLALKRAWTQAQADADTIGLIEAHGTGTAAGDAAEVTALSELLVEAGALPHSCAIGSVKSMIGHTKSAAGLAGVMKVALALHHKVLPPTLNVTQPNQRLSDPASPLFANTESRPWLARPDGIPRRAGVSSFGFGGTNFHALIEEYAGDTRAVAETSAAEQWPRELFLWAAPSSARLASTLEEFSAALSGSEASLASVGAALAAKGSSTSGQVRLAIVASSAGDLAGKLTLAREWLRLGKSSVSDPAKGIHLGSGSEAPSVAFLFPGQGSQYPGMLRELATYLPEMRQEMVLFDQETAGVFPRRLSSYIDPPSLFTREEKAASMQALTATHIAQPALGCVEIGLYRFLQRVGLEPRAVAGHSYGEYVALCAAGVISPRALMQLSEARGRAISQTTSAESGAMAAVPATPQQVRSVLGEEQEITLANFNAPAQTVIAGTNASIGRALERLAAAGIDARKIPVACAFHSPWMEPARSVFEDALSRQTFAAPRIAAYSNTLGGVFPSDGAEIEKILSSHLVLPVDFVGEVSAMYRDGVRVFVEVGPKTVLSGLVRKILDGTDAEILATDAGSTDASHGHGLFQLLNVIGGLAALGCAVRMEELFRGRGRNGTSPEVPAPATPAWLVNGARAYAASGEPPRKTPVPMRAIVAAPQTASVPPAPALPAIGTSAGSDVVMHQFQQLMGQFLSMQSAVMTQFLQGGSEVISSPIPIPMPIPVAAPTTAVVQAAVVQAAVEIAAPARTEGNVKTQLLSVVQERTGYPTEMLDLNAGLEADLGIDSIKRVEIIGAFRRSRTPEQQVVLQNIVEKLTAARNLREIIEHCETALGSQEPPPLTAPAFSQPGPLQIQSDFIRLVSERTGYPAELLDLNAAIEADLGIDSIKRVEIIGAFRRSLPEAQQQGVQKVIESLTAARTLQEIISRLSNEFHPAKESPDSESVPGLAKELTRLRLVALPSPPRPTAPRFVPGRVTLITDDETGIASALAEVLERHGEKPVLLRQCEQQASSAPGVIHADLTDAAAVHAALDLARHEYGPAGALLHLLPLRESPDTGDQTLAGWDRQLQLDLRTLYLLTREVAPDLEKRGASHGAFVAVATGRGGDFGLVPNPSLPVTHFAAADFVKSFALETSARCKVIDVDPAESAASLRDTLLDEIWSAPHQPDHVQTGFHKGRRVIAAAQLCSVGEGRPHRIDKDWVFLLTGGARGITAEIAGLLALRHQPTLILAGQSPVPEEESADTAHLSGATALKAALLHRMQNGNGAIVKPRDLEAAFQRLSKAREIRATLRQLRDAGARVEYVSLDVRNESQMNGLIGKIYREFGRLDVVIHGAGIIEDKLLRDKTPDSFDRVVQTKAHSVFLLHRALRPESLRCLILMSSISAAFGNRGQADYAAANGVMNGLAAKLAAEWPCRVVAMNWGPWDQAGMVSEEVRAQFRERQVALIAPEAGAAAVLREIEGSSAESLVAFGDGPWTADALPADKPVAEAFAAQVGAGA